MSVACNHKGQKMSLETGKEVFFLKSTSYSNTNDLKKSLLLNLTFDSKKKKEWLLVEVEGIELQNNLPSFFRQNPSPCRELCIYPPV